MVADRGGCVLGLFDCRKDHDHCRIDLMLDNISETVLSVTFSITRQGPHSAGTITLATRMCL